MLKHTVGFVLLLLPQVLASSLVRHNFDLDMCASRFPAFLTYLDDTFGHPLTRSVDGISDADLDGTFEVTLRVSDDNVVEALWTNKKALEAVHPSHKRRPWIFGGVFAELQEVLRRHGDMLRSQVKALQSPVKMYFRYGDRPGGVGMHANGTSGIPVHGMSSNLAHRDIAMPDFTFRWYPEIEPQTLKKTSFTGPQNGTTTSWDQVASRLRQVVPKRRGFIWRGAPTNPQRKEFAKLVAQGAPSEVKRLLDAVAPDGFDVKMMTWRSKTTPDPDYVSLDDQCKWTYSFHVAGVSYAAALKYKLACGQTVFVIRDDQTHEEFWYRALQDKVNVYFIKADLSDLWSVLADAFATSHGQDAMANAAMVGEAGRAVAESYLSQTGVDCYTMLYLQRYYLPFLKRLRTLDQAAI